jgi:hypothetical protein
MLRKVKQLQIKLTDGLKQLTSMKNKTGSDMKNIVIKGDEEQKSFRDYESRIETIFAQKQASIKDELSNKSIKEEQEIYKLVEGLTHQKEELRDCQRQIVHLEELLRNGLLNRRSKRG